MNKAFQVFATLLLIVQSFFLYASLCQGDVPFAEDQDAYLKAIADAQLGNSYFDGQKNPLLAVSLSWVVSPR